MDTKKEIVLAAIKDVVPTKDTVEAAEFAKRHLVCRSVALNVAEQVETLSNEKAVTAFNNFLIYLYERGSINLEELEDRDQWIEQFKNDIKL